MAIVNRFVASLTKFVPPALTSIFINNTVPNLSGDRDIEWSWVSAHIPDGPGKALDFGAGPSFLGLIAAQRRFEVTAVDLLPCRWEYTHPNLIFIQGDLLKVNLPEKFYDLIINCSTVEHVGLGDRYGNAEKGADGDLEAMSCLRSLMKPQSLMLLTVPAGRDCVYPALHRVYGHERLPKLIDGYLVEKEAYWIKDDNNKWQLTTKDAALKFESSAGSWNPLKNIYALACFVLRCEKHN